MFWSLEIPFKTGFTVSYSSLVLYSLYCLYLFMIRFTSIFFSVSVFDVFLNHVSESSVYFSFSIPLSLFVLYVCENPRVPTVLKYKWFDPKHDRYSQHLIQNMIDTRNIWSKTWSILATYPLITSFSLLELYWASKWRGLRVLSNFPNCTSYFSVCWHLAWRDGLLYFIYRTLFCGNTTASTTTTATNNNSIQFNSILVN